MPYDPMHHDVHHGHDAMHHGGYDPHMHMNGMGYDPHMNMNGMMGHNHQMQNPGYNPNTMNGMGMNGGFQGVHTDVWVNGKQVQGAQASTGFGFSKGANDWHAGGSMAKPSSITTGAGSTAAATVMDYDETTVTDSNGTTVTASHLGVASDIPSDSYLGNFYGNNYGMGGQGQGQKPGSAANNWFGGNTNNGA